MKVLHIEKYTPQRIPARGWRMEPSDTRAKILAAIRAAEAHGETLSVRQLVKTCGISTTSVVQYHLRQLARDGDLTFGVRGVARGVRLTEQGRGYPSDEAMLCRCLEWFEQNATGGALIDDLRARLRVER